jgi:ketosteroid isomerase-like protein
MNFRQTLDKHVRAIRGRDLPALIETLPENELILIQSNGRLLRTVREFVEAHRGWFQSTTWTLDFQEESVLETPDLGVAVYRLEYRDRLAEGSPIHEFSRLTLIFARRGDRWVMVLDQNTPIKGEPG